MPLSENEEQILAEIERQLAAEDPRFAARTRRGRRSFGRAARLRAAIVLAVVGVASVLSIGFVEGTGGTVAGAFGMVMLFVAILLGASLLAGKTPRDQVVVPPDERT